MSIIGEAIGALGNLTFVLGTLNAEKKLLILSQLKPFDSHLNLRNNCVHFRSNGKPAIWQQIC
jgi:hypothetical protein